jgi:hypothetical protein
MLALAAIVGLPACKSPTHARKTYSHESQETEEYWPQSGGADAPAPYRAGKALESQQRVADATPTPTPTPNRPIDRPLDPTGLPMMSPTP